MGIVPFIGTHNEARWMGRILSIPPFLELNVRTYVKYKGQQGVFFITEDGYRPEEPSLWSDFKSFS
ncbi:hypothetical protein CR194_13310 [Salipaludibacillus keqinensis]|uniref:Uncharacterized protein n=2 Tax=Salipaludibacillus keqinensis TaxID=2045207 RepID=A0A323TCV5_9BACI|nr:hypothetical protein CR194_13310 [Salipaludibacillus keqinensis]